ncbi:MAG: phage terminase small subunit P27 family, partial [Lachnospiraceae bacterium]|nr:phage terminase small subunit P27 family [Lachnospiraceae bacterium]
DKFNEIAEQLLDIGIMSNLDCDVLARYVRSQTEYEKITRQLSRIKFTPDRKSMDSAEEQMAEQAGKYNYLQKIQVRLEKQCNADARELGLTIASRCRLVMPKKEETPTENKFLRHA